MKLEGKTALVTGTSPNIMGGIAEELAREGANLVCVDVREEYAEKCAAAIVAEGHEAMGVVCDVTDEDQVLAAISQATERFGGVDILVNGAALFNFKGVLNMPVEEWRRQTDIILTGAFLFTKHVAHQMIEQGRPGNIINIISTAGHQGEPGNVGYGTAKGGLLNFTRSVAMELSGHGIPRQQPDADRHQPGGGTRTGCSLGCRMAAAAPGRTRRRIAARCQQRGAPAQTAQPVKLRQGRGFPGVR